MASKAGIRRSGYLVTYWQHGSHLAYNYLTCTSHPCSATVVAILEATSQWTTRESVHRAFPRGNRGIIDRTIDELLQDRLLDSSDRPPLPAERALAAWGSWNPVAGFFHAATRSAFSGGPEESKEGERPFLVDRDFPPTVKKYPHHHRFELPACRDTGQLTDALRNRRTWREFGDRRLTLDEVATLLGLTFGVQRWLDIDDDRWVALKSSPSGGARHSIEAYLMSFGVDGLANGTYHYCPDAHALTLLGSPVPSERMTAFVPRQPWLHDPAVFVVMTSIFSRVQYKYAHPYAYRVVLLDAGHLSQTFLLVATALGLAPFCVAALDGPAIEQHLGIDGISESVIHAVGVGSKPEGKEWAPLRAEENPRTASPTWAKRLPALFAP